MQTILNVYYKNNAKKLHHMVDKLLSKFGGIEDKDIDDFYSLANEVFVDVLSRYDRNQPFETFLYSCLDRKIKTEMTRRNRKKRQADQNSISWETPLDEESETTIGDFIKDTKQGNDFDIDKTFFEDNGEKYSEKMLFYISRLSSLQKETAKLIISGYTQKEIMKILHISESKYMDLIAALGSCRNIDIFLKK